LAILKIPPQLPSTAEAAARKLIEIAHYSDQRADAVSA